MKVEALAKLIDAPFQGNGETAVSGFSTDSNAIKPGDMFIAKKGVNADGHDFIDSAVANGASALLVSREIETDIPQIIVDDTLVAFGQLASAWRSQFNIPVVAITGSVGKTTVRGMCASVLSTVGNVLETEGNLNTEVGLPITLLRMTAIHQYAVVELAATKPGDISYLTHIAKPTHAMITTIAPAHLDGFGSIEKVFETKSEIFESFDSKGVVVINLDDSYADRIAARTENYEQLFYSASLEKDIHATALTRGEDNTYTYTLVTPKGNITITLPTPGLHNVKNSLAAAAIAVSLDLPLEKIQQGLASYQPITGRLQVKSGFNEARIIDDTYNANLSSVIAGLEVLAGYKGEKIFVFGEMAGLGDESESHHRKVGEVAKKLGIRKLYACGEFTRFAVEAFGGAGQYFEDKQTLISSLKAQLSNDATILVKGSRAAKMEEVVLALT